MKKIFLLLTIFLLNGCAESLALLSPGATNGRFVQSSLNSAISYEVKKQTGKTPLEHAVAYAVEKNPDRKKETCISSFEITRSEFCTIVKKQIKLKSSHNICLFYMKNYKTFILYVYCTILKRVKSFYLLF